MSAILITKSAVLLLLILFSAFFSGSETSFFSLGRIERYRLRNGNESLTQRWVHQLVQRPRRLLVSILVGNECINITASAITASLTNDVFARWLPQSAADGFFLKTLAATAVIFPLILIFGEITPKTLALRNPQRFARFVVVPLRLFVRLITPVRWVLHGLAIRMAHLTLGSVPSGESPITEKEFRTLVDMSKEEGELWESEHQFIHNIFEFGETRVSEVMTPRTDMVCLRLGQSLQETLQAIEDHHFSRIPAYEKDKDDIVGVLYSKDLLQEGLDPALQETWNLRSILRKPYFIPQTKKANDLFREFRVNRIHMAIVVDEYGGVAGLVTMEDLLEDLFGEILDEYDPEVPKVRHVDRETLIIPARMPIEEFNRRLDTTLPEEEYDTMGGLVFDLFGRLPSPGAKVSYMHYTFTVEKMLGTRILEIRVQKQSEPDETGEEEWTSLPEKTENQEQD